MVLFSLFVLVKFLNKIFGSLCAFICPEKPCQSESSFSMLEFALEVKLFFMQNISLWHLMFCENNVGSRFCNSVNIMTNFGNSHNLECYYAILLNRISFMRRPISTLGTKSTYHLECDCFPRKGLLLCNKHALHTTL